jgi:hypothetical protein
LNLVNAHQLLVTADKWFGLKLFGQWYTISALCGSLRAGCLFCKVVCRLIDLRWPDHCVNAAKHERLA